MVEFWYITFLSSSSSESFCIFSYFLCSVLHLRKKLTSFSFNQSSFTIASSTKLAGVMQKSDRPILFLGFTAYSVTSVLVTDIGDRCWWQNFMATTSRCWWLMYKIEKLPTILILSPKSWKCHHYTVSNILLSLKWPESPLQLKCIKRPKQILKCNS